jgi:hypothetical protein
LYPRKRRALLILPFSSAFEKLATLVFSVKDKNGDFGSLLEPGWTLALLLAALPVSLFGCVSQLQQLLLLDWLY